MTKQRQNESDPRGAVDHRWAVILAGGDGRRLLPLTRRLSGDDRPKQFCRVLGDETLLDQTLRRVATDREPGANVLRRDQGARELLFRDQTGIARRGSLLVQPHNRGTGPAIVYSLMRLERDGPKCRRRDSSRQTIISPMTERFPIVSGTPLNPRSRTLSAVILLGIVAESAGDRIRLDRAWRTDYGERFRTGFRSTTLLGKTVQRDLPSS